MYVNLENLIRDTSLTIWLYVSFPCVCVCSKNNRSIDTPVKGPPQGPRLHIDIPRVQLLIEDKEGIKQIGMWLHSTTTQISFISVIFYLLILDNWLFCCCCCICSSVAYNRGGQGSGASDRHRVQPISEPAELLYGRVSAPPSPYPEFRAFDWHVRHTSRHEWVFLFR